MRVFVTGARGFVGRNLCCALKNIRDGKDRREKFQGLLPLEVMEYDVDSTPEELDVFCSRADFVFNLAGVNRPKDQSEFMEGNFGFASTLLETLERHGNTCPVMLSSSAQASLSGRFVSVNIIFTISTNAFSPIAPTRIRRIRQRGCAAFGA